MTKDLIMSNNIESQCYVVQLQIDGYIDGDLSQSQQELFMSHVHSCEACAQEFHYAQVVQDTVLELPQLDCNDQVLEPVHRLLKDGDTKINTSSQSILSQIKALVSDIPAFIRYGVPVALSVALAVFISSSLPDADGVNSLSQDQVALEVNEQYSPEEVFQALQDLNLAIDYLNQMSQRTEVMIGNRFLVTPLQDSINASFQRTRGDTTVQNDPI
ncbi:MAG: hypothetical protein COA96_10800 [SAR86 cluster bacterium]|uniref:Putative zinc-finger domain-containing protein n=1 Tax=SAR86 cluster bacterium TaxID=2030880 RepID=A0A2A5AX26_9GAMM|nr:MAG: hypothetical protein COA96_10800 [SAR86 cluster bacterium]